MTAAARQRERMKIAEAKVIRARKWIETCVDPVAVGPARKQAMLDYLAGTRDVPDDLTEIPRGDDG